MTTTFHNTPDDVRNSGDGGAGDGSSTSILMTLKDVCFETRLCRTTVY